jgi:acetyl-CoA acetyltransferase
MHRSPQAPDQAGSGKGLARAGLELGDLDLFELNEAFAAMVRKRRPQFDSQVRTGATDGYCY